MGDQPIKPESPSPAVQAAFGLFGWAALIGLPILLGIFTVYFFPRNGHATVVGENGGSQILDPDFGDWVQKKPSLVLVLTGQMHGYVGPCGCSDPQYGGLIRRWNFVKELEGRGWKVAGIDVGELLAPKGIREQSMLKYQYTMMALDKIGYRAFGLSKSEFDNDAVNVLSSHFLNLKDPVRPRPILSTHNEAWDANSVYRKFLHVRPYEVLADTTPKVGVSCLFGPGLTEIIDPKQSNKLFSSNTDVLRLTMEKFAEESVGLNIALYHEYPKVLPGRDFDRDPEREDLVRKLAKWVEDERQKKRNWPKLDLVISLTEEEEPPAVLRPITPEDGAKRVTNFLTVGHKGRCVGVLGVFPRKGGDGFDLDYKLVHLGPKYSVKPGEEKNNPVLQDFEVLQNEIRKQNFLAKQPRSKHPSAAIAKQQLNLDLKYIGSDACASCHELETVIWQKSHHSNAFDTLVNKAKNPGNRQFDPECVICHTVGFQHETGYFDKQNKPNDNLELLHVGCESCHGPGSAHAKTPRNAALYPLINEFRATDKELDPATPAAARKLLAQRRQDLIESKLCMSCHDTENDVQWTKVGGFPVKWFQGGKDRKVVEHNNPERLKRRIAEIAERKGAPATASPVRESPRKEP